MIKNECPQQYDIEPTCFQVVPSIAIRHTQEICQLLDIPKSSIRIALALMIPNLNDPSKFLYGLRDPSYHTEYKNTWGLPSIGMSQETFLQIEEEPLSVQEVMQQLSENKLKGANLNFSRFVGWTGRSRNPKLDSQFAEPYYLIMVDAVTKPVDPNLISMSTDAYTNLVWLTTQEHADLVTASPNKACGACSQLAFAAVNNGNI